MGDIAVRWFGKPLRPWQQYAADRILELDRRGELRWPFVVLTVGRQQGKSRLLMALQLWRLFAADRFGEPQQCTMVTETLELGDEQWTPVAEMLAEQAGAVVRRRIGGQRATLPDGSLWRLLPNKPRHGTTSSMVTVDEAAKVQRNVVEHGLMPQMIAPNQPQLLICGSAGDKASDLLTTFRERALEGEGETLLLEWSSPPDVTDVDDQNAWKWALPEWDRRKYMRLRNQTDETAWRVEYMNQWVQAVDGWVSRSEWAACAHLDVQPGADGMCVVGQSMNADAYGAVWACDVDGRTVVRSFRSHRKAAVWQWVRELPDGVDVRIGNKLNGRQPEDVAVSGVWTTTDVKVGLANVQNAIREGKVVHDGDATLTEHVLRAVRRITGYGETVFALPVHPDELAHMLVVAADLVEKRQRGPVMV